MDHATREKKMELLRFLQNQVGNLSSGNNLKKVYNNKISQLNSELYPKQSKGAQSTQKTFSSNNKSRKRSRRKRSKRRSRGRRSRRRSRGRRSRRRSRGRRSRRRSRGRRSRRRSRGKRSRGRHKRRHRMETPSGAGNGMPDIGVTDMLMFGNCSGLRSRAELLHAVDGMPPLEGELAQYLLETYPRGQCAEFSLGDLRVGLKGEMTALSGHPEHRYLRNEVFEPLSELERGSDGIEIAGKVLKDTIYDLINKQYLKLGVIFGTVSPSPGGFRQPAFLSPSTVGGGTAATPGTRQTSVPFGTPGPGSSDLYGTPLART